MVNDCLVVRDSHQHRLQHLSPGSEGAIFACLQGCMCIYIYTYMCVRACYNIYIYLYIYISIYIYIYIYISIYIYICVCVRVLLYIYVCVSMHIYMQLYGIDLFIIDLSIYLSVYLSIYLSVCLSVCPSVCLSVCLICLSTYLSICLSIDPSLKKKNVHIATYHVFIYIYNWKVKANMPGLHWSSPGSGGPSTVVLFVFLEGGSFQSNFFLDRVRRFCMFFCLPG